MRRDLVVLLLCQQVVESFIDGLVVVILDRPQVGFDQLQLVYLVKQKQVISCHVNNTNCKEKREGESFIEADDYLAEIVDGSAMIQPWRQYSQQVIE